MDKQLIERLALEVAKKHARYLDRVHISCIPEFAQEFLAAVDAERGKEAVGYLSEASPLTKGVCNDERSCSACFSGQGKCELAPQPAIPEGMAPEVTDEMARIGAHILSEWLDDMAPLHERRYLEPAKAAFKAMIAAAGVAP